MTRLSTHGQARATRSLLALTNHLLPVRVAWEENVSPGLPHRRRGTRGARPSAETRPQGRTLTGVMAERKHLRGGAGLAVAMGVMNVASYLFTILAARLLGPRDYGAFAALMGLLLVITVASLALQATAARRIATTPGHVHQIEQVILRVGVQAALGLGPAVPGAVAGDQPGGPARQSRYGGTRRVRRGAPHPDGRPGRDPAGRTPVVRALPGLRGCGCAQAHRRHGHDRVVAHRVRCAARRRPGGLRPGAWSAGSPSGARATPARRPGTTARARSGARRSTTPTRCSPSSRSPTSTSSSPATCWTSTRPVCTPAG